MQNKTADFTNSNTTNSTGVYHFSQNTHHQDMGFALGRILNELYGWLSRYVTNLFSLPFDQGEIVKAQIHHYKMNQLNNILQEPFKTHREIAHKVAAFYDSLLPFEQDNIDQISQIIFDEMCQHNGLETAVFVAENSDVPELRALVHKKNPEGKNYAYMLDTIAGVKPISPKEDLKQLQLAAQHLTKTGDTWLGMTPKMLHRISINAAKCQQKSISKDSTQHARLQLLRQIYPARLIQAVGGLEKLFALPVLSTTQQHIGDTDYLDRIDPKEMDTPLKRGVDALGRPFIAVCYEIHGHEQVEVLFQRYSDNNDIWQTGSTPDVNPQIQANTRLSGLHRKENSKQVDDMLYVKNIIKGNAKVGRHNPKPQHSDEPEATFGLCQRQRK